MYTPLWGLCGQKVANLATDRKLFRMMGTKQIVSSSPIVQGGNSVEK